MQRWTAAKTLICLVCPTLDRPPVPFLADKLDCLDDIQQYALTPPALQLVGLDPFPSLSH